MKYFTIITLYFLGLHLTIAQDLESRLGVNDRIECSVYAENSSEIIGTYDILQIDSVVAVLNIWERECGKSEPIMRIQILHDIYFGQFDSGNYKEYYDQYIRKYMYRMEIAERSTAQSNYEHNKSYYDYTQIGNGFDKHTVKLAALLLDRQEVGTDAYLLCLLFSNDFVKFDKAAYKRSTAESPVIDALFNSNTSLFSNIRFSGSLGVWMPLGKNKNRFSVSPMLSVGIHQPISSHWRIDGLFAVVPFVNNQALDFRFEGKNESAKSLVSLNFDVGLTRQNKLSEKSFLDTGFTLGVNVLATDIDNPDEEEATQGVSTIDLGAKVGMRRKLDSDRSIAIQLGIHYAPYNWSGNLTSKVGESYASVGLAYGF